MLHATFTISSTELTTELLEKIKMLFPKDNKDFEVTISVKPKESPEAAKMRIDQAIENIESGNDPITFSPEEYDKLVHQLNRR